MENNTKVVFLAFFIAIIAVASILATAIGMSVTSNTKSYTQRVTACVASGGDWTDITPHDDYPNMGCLHRG